MSPDAAPGIDARVDVGATLPWLPTASVVALLVGLVALGGAVALIVSAARAAARDRPPTAPHDAGPTGHPPGTPGR
jgi:hypothetical protein